MHNLHPNVSEEVKKKKRLCTASSKWLASALFRLITKPNNNKKYDYEAVRGSAEAFWASFFFFLFSFKCRLNNMALET